MPAGGALESKTPVGPGDEFIVMSNGGHLARICSAIDRWPDSSGTLGLNQRVGRHAEGLRQLAQSSTLSGSIGGISRRSCLSEAEIAVRAISNQKDFSGSNKEAHVLCFGSCSFS